jgi:Flp pilus assembly pilin Flp
MRGAGMEWPNSGQHARKDACGATSIEYAFLASLIGVAIVATVLLLGESLPPFFQQVVDGL